MLPGLFLLHAATTEPSPLPRSPEVEEAEERCGFGRPVHHTLTVGGEMASITLIYG